MFGRKGKKKKEKRVKRRVSKNISVSFVWRIILVGALLLMSVGVVWAFVYYQKVANNEVVGDTEVTGDRLESVNREKLGDTIVDIEKRNQYHNDLFDSKPNVREPRARVEARAVNE